MEGDDEEDDCCGGVECRGFAEFEGASCSCLFAAKRRISLDAGVMYLSIAFDFQRPIFPTSARGMPAVTAEFVAPLRNE